MSGALTLSGGSQNRAGPARFYEPPLDLRRSGRSRGVALRGGSARRDYIRDMVEGMGGKLEAFYFAFGEPDAYTLLDLPDHATAAALSLTVSGSGALRISTQVLLTPEEVDQAGGKTLPDYRPPGS